MVANGTSTTTAIATVTDSGGGHPSGRVVSFSSSDPAEEIGPTTDLRDGTYTATITSSTAVGPATITAVADSVVGTATLTQTANTGNATTTFLSAAPTARVTNQSVFLVAFVASTPGAAAPSGAITFFNGPTPIPGCVNEPLDSNQSATCKTSFAASDSPVPVKAVFTPASGASVAASQSALDDLIVGRDSASTAVDVSNPTIIVGANATYTATVTPNPRNPGPIEPSGSVEFLDGGKPIASCVKQALVQGKFARAMCTVRYRQQGTHDITATYQGDANFAPSAASAVQPVHVRKQSPKVRGTVISTMQWTFFHTPSYTKVLALLVNHAPVGGRVLVTCQGRGCPFAKLATAVTAVTRRCAPHGKHGSRTCATRRPRTVNLLSRFRDHRLRPGARFIVELIRPGSIGKHYHFAILAGRAPRVEIRCLAPGRSRPGVGC
ncbi:MAG: Ig-like domain repeat protein [Solirubrobacteraceae bacterium]